MAVRPEVVQIGRRRAEGDDCRRYRPIAVTFDTRATALDTTIEDDWDPAVRSQWETTQSAIRMQILAEMGTVGGETKISNFRAMGPAPWSIAYEHTEALRQIRSAFAHGDFYPALVGACALGERLFNQLILALRDDYASHRATTRDIREHKSFSNWRVAIDVLHCWGVLTDAVAETYTRLSRQRNVAIHFSPSLDATARESALEAVLAIQDIIREVLAPLGGPPTYIADTEGASYLALEAEDTPLVRRIFIPRSVLVSPAHRLYPNADSAGVGWTVVDDGDYEPSALTDAEFAAALPAGTASMHPEFATDANS